MQTSRIDTATPDELTPVLLSALQRLGHSAAKAPWRWPAWRNDVASLLAPHLGMDVMTIMARDQVPLEDEENRLVKGQQRPSDPNKSEAGSLALL